MNMTNRDQLKDVVSNSIITAIIADMDDLAAEHPDELLVIHNIFAPVVDQVGSRFLAEIEDKVWNYRCGRPKVKQAATLS
jgi:hypothetical protein